MEDPSQVRARIRRWYVPNAIYFITAATKDRKPVFAQEANVNLLRETMRRVRDHHPFKMHAYAMMPDHLHLLIYVPDTTDISKLVQSIQWNMTRNYKCTMSPERYISGSVASGTMLSAMIWTMNGISTTFTTIPSSMGWHSIQGNTRTPVSRNM